MRDIRECSGPWRGQWTQGDIRGAMGMRLEFRDCFITGSGSDNNGPFSITGRYDPATDSVQLLKAYPILLVSYDGTWNGQFVHGKSMIGLPLPFDLGTFEMWPQNEEEAIEELVAERELSTSAT